MKTTFNSLLCFLLLSICSSAQTSPKAQPGCGIYGHIRDKQSGEKIAFATVHLYRNDTLVAQATTGADGSYCFRQAAKARYRVKAISAGYQTLEVKLQLAALPQKTDIQLQHQPQPEPKKKDVKTVFVEDARLAHELVAPSTTHGQPGFATFQGIHADFNTEEYSKVDDNGFKAAEKDPLSTFSIDVDKASYSNVRRFINQGQLPPADAVRIEEFVNYFSYNYAQPADGQPFAVHTQLLACPWNGKRQLVHIGIQGRDVKTEHLPANNLVFLLDVSGSMESADKLPLLKSALRLLVDQLRPQDRVSIVVYAGAAGLVLEPTAGNRKEEILAALDRLQAGGSTAGGQGIQLAYNTARKYFMKEGNNRVVLATDGDFNVGASSEGELVRLIEKEREDGIYLTVLGFGTGNYKDARMEQLADKGNGNYAYIDNLLEAKKTLVKEMGGTLLTIAKDVKIQVEFNPAKVKAYRLVGYENRLLNKEDFNDDKKDAGELGAGHTVTAIYEIIPAGSDEPVASVDVLKYQAMSKNTVPYSNEVMTLKLRYKQPTESQSRLIAQVLADKPLRVEQASEDVRFATAVAAFGMLLRNSEYKGNSSYAMVLAQARASKGRDEEGYRAEFIRLVEMAELLQSRHN